jgi:hypothetical protein
MWLGLSDSIGCARLFQPASTQEIGHVAALTPRKIPGSGPVALSGNRVLSSTISRNQLSSFRGCGPPPSSASGPQPGSLRRRLDQKSRTSLLCAELRASAARPGYGLLCPSFAHVLEIICHCRSPLGVGCGATVSTSLPWQLSIGPGCLSGNRAFPLYRCSTHWGGSQIRIGLLSKLKRTDPCVS